MNKKGFYASTAWKWFRKYVILHYSKDGVCRCVTCGALKKVGDPKLHLGHLIKVFDSGAKTNFATAFDERNAAPQCYKCNVKEGGRELDMMNFINNKFGKGTYDKLRDKARNPIFGFRMELPAIAEKYKKKCKELEKQRSA